MWEFMERVAAAAIRQGFWVRQTEKGQYIFRNGNVYVIFPVPEDYQQWRQVLSDLVRAGLIWPPPRR